MMACVRRHERHSEAVYAPSAPGYRGTSPFEC